MLKLLDNISAIKTRVYFDLGIVPNNQSQGSLRTSEEDET